MSSLASPLAAVALVTLGGLQGGADPAAETPRFVGTWVSEGGGFTNVTTLHADGRFRTERLAGIRPVETFAGRWQVRGNAIAWSYGDAVKDPTQPEDVNPIVSEAADRFTLRELDGSESTFFRKGLPEPNSPRYLPIAIGTGWVLEDELGEFVIRVTTRERVAGRDCYRADWIQGDRPYQSEYWIVGEEGIRVAGRRVFGLTLVEFPSPYLLLKQALIPGDKWDASMTVAERPHQVTISVGAEEAVSTPAGLFQAVPVTLRGPAMHYVHWYAQGVGLVREDFVLEDRRVNTKTLNRRLE